MANEAAPATVAPETGAAKPGGDGTPAAKDASSLIGEALKGKSVEKQLEILAETQDAMAKTERKKTTAYPPPIPAKADEPQPEDEPSPEEPTGEDPDPTTETVAEGEPTSEAPPADEDEAEFNAKGNKVTLRRSRFERLLTAEGRAKAAEERENAIVQAILERTSKPDAETPKDTPDPMLEKLKAINQRITDAKEKIRKADKELDKDAEIAAQDELIDAKSDLKALEVEARMQERMQEQARELTNQTQTEKWMGEIAQAEKTHKELRDKQFKEDCARYPELAERKSELHKQAFSILEEWRLSGRKVALAPDCERLAVEQAARELGLTSKAIVVTPTPTAQPKTGTRTSGPKPTGAVIRGSTPLGRSLPSKGEILAKVGQLRKDDLRSVLQAVADKIG